MRRASIAASELIYVSSPARTRRTTGGLDLFNDLIAEGYSESWILRAPRGRTAEDRVLLRSRHAGTGQDKRAFRSLYLHYSNVSERETATSSTSPLVDSMTRFLACRIVPYLGSGDVPTPQRRKG